MMKVQNGPRSGVVTPPASKSAAHRLLILAALGTSPVSLELDGLSEDIEATIRCLEALGAAFTIEKDRIRVTPIPAEDKKAGDGSTEETQDPVVLPCGESGSTLRFLLPVTAALGIPAVFRMEGRLSERPLSGLTETLEENGAVIEKSGDELRLSGGLAPGAYTIPGNISSQYVTGLLLALPLLPAASTLSVQGKLESENYVRMTEKGMRLAGIQFECAPLPEGLLYRIPGAQHSALPEETMVERDWSGAANFLVMGAFSEKGILVRGLDTDSAQGDRRILEILKNTGAKIETSEDGIRVSRGTLQGQTTDVAMIPDLVPVLSVLGALSSGETRIENAARLRLKESDRLATTTALLKALGATITENADSLVIEGKPLRCGEPVLSGGSVPACRDHRIVMAAAVAAIASREPVMIPEADAVNKSYPAFFEDLAHLEVES